MNIASWFETSSQIVASINTATRCIEQPLRISGTDFLVGIYPESNKGTSSKFADPAVRSSCLLAWDAGDTVWWWPAELRQHGHFRIGTFDCSANGKRQSFLLPRSARERIWV